MSANPEEPNFEAIDLDALQKTLMEHAESTGLKQAEIMKIKMEIAELASKVTELSRSRTILEEEVKRESTVQRDLEKQIASARRLQDVKVEQELLRKEYESKAARLDELTATAKWREFAFDHQITGAKRLGVSRRGILADKRGLGKTLTSIVWGDMVEAKRVLVLAPNDVVPQFEEEIRTWAPSRAIFPLRGLSKSQRDLIYPMLNMVPEFIVTLNYEAWRKDKTVIDDLIKAGIDTIICDEAHRIKSSDKITARGVFQLAYRPNYCMSCEKIDNFMGPWEKPQEKRLANTQTRVYGARVADVYDGECPKCGMILTSTVKNMLCMTGTPILNKPQELFSMLFLTNRKQFPSERNFLRDYCYNAGANKWRFQYGGLDRLTRYMSEFFIARTREEAGITLPPPSVKIYEVEKDLVNYAKQYEAERRMSEQAALLLEDGTRKDIFFILEMILRERQIMTWPAGIEIKDPETGSTLCKFDVEESQKMDEAMDLLYDLCEEEERIIVFSQFKGPLYEMQRRLRDKGITACLATGDQDDFTRQKIRQDFDLKTAPKGVPGEVGGPRWQVCLATYKAFGTGINLNAARHVVFLDDEWNPGMEDQAIGRIDRMNSTDQANVHIFRVKNSVDDFMAGILEEKRAVVEGFETKSVEQKLRGWFNE